MSLSLTHLSTQSSLLTNVQCSWIYPAEILPLKIRAKGAALAAAADFLGNFLVVEVTPVGLKSIGWRFYIVWAVLNLVNAIIVWFFYPETGGLQLEAIDQIFIEKNGDGVGDYGTTSGRETKGVRKLQWRMVPRSLDAVRDARRNGSALVSAEDMVATDGKGAVGGLDKTTRRHIEVTEEASSASSDITR